jgi:hypothetical protein
LALSAATQEAIGLRRLLSDLHEHQNLSTKIFEDNQGAIELTKNNKHHNRTKHIDIRHHFIRSHIDNCDVSIDYTPNDRQPADILTKPLPTTVFLRYRDV